MTIEIIILSGLLVMALLACWVLYNFYRIECEFRQDVEAREHEQIQWRSRLIDAIRQDIGEDRYARLYQRYRHGIDAAHGSGGEGKQ